MGDQREILTSDSTEEKIKDAARRVFTRKGYAATRTRDIAEESGYNLALINYYFRSKEKLFDIIMIEQLQLFVHSVVGIVDDPSSSLQTKVALLINHYIDMLISNPNIPIFVLSEVNANPHKLAAKLGFDKVDHGNIALVQQWKTMCAEHKITINPLHILLNVLSMTIFPFVASPLLRERTGLTMDDFNELMQERKKLIPVWIQAMIMATGTTGATTTKAKKKNA